MEKQVPGAGGAVGDGEVAMPPMPQRMRSNKTFQPESGSLKIEPDLIQEPERINADTISQISVDYAHHMKNKKRIADLIKMLGKGGANADIEDVDIQIGDSISNIDAVSQS